jgi:hypothetical protein
MLFRRVATCVAAVCLLGVGCNRLQESLSMQEPLEALPEGACMVVSATDLVKIWQRAEQHKAAEVLGRLVPNAGWFQTEDYRQVRAALEEFESTNEVDLERDLLLNVLGGRVVIGMYPESSGEADLVLAAELGHPDRFRRFVDAVLAQPLGHDIDIEAVVIDDKQAFWVRHADQQVLFMHEGKRLVASTREDLARSTWDVIEGRATTSATQNPQFTRALAELGMHHVVVVEIGDATDRIPWAAQGMTWRGDGLHFKRTVAAPPQEERVPSLVTPRQRDEMLQSIPRGMTLAYYARPTDADLVRDLLRGLTTCGGSMGGSLWRQSEGADGVRMQLTRAQSGPGLRVPHFGTGARLLPVASSDSPLGMSSLPFNLEKDVLPWCGDELVFILADLEKTGVIPIPAAALIIEVADEELAGSTLYDLESTLTNLPFDIGAKGFVDVRYGGQTYRSFSQPFLESISPSWWTNGDIAVISTTRLLMQQIIDTRRVGKRHLLNDSSFEGFASFVPESASVLALTDLRRFYRSAHEMAELPRMLSEEIDDGVRYMEEMSVLFDHFPTSAVYLDRQEDTLTLNAWLREDH